MIGVQNGAMGARPRWSSASARGVAEAGSLPCLSAGGRLRGRPLEVKSPA
jgi:hypothetical protein